MELGVEFREEKVKLMHLHAFYHQFISWFQLVII